MEALYEQLRCLHASLKLQCYCNGPCGDRTRVADSRVQRLNHWAIKVPERPSRLRLAGSLHYSPLFEIRAPWLGPLSTKAGSFHSQANPGYRCHQCNGPCGDRTRFADSRVQPLNHWAIKVPERPSRLRLAGSLHYKQHCHQMRPCILCLSAYVKKNRDSIQRFIPVPYKCPSSSP